MMGSRTTSLIASLPTRAAGNRYGAAILLATETDRGSQAFAAVEARKIMGFVGASMWRWTRMDVWNFWFCDLHRADPRRTGTGVKFREQVQGLRQRVCAAHAAASGWP